MVYGTLQPNAESGRSNHRIWTLGSAISISIAFLFVLMAVTPRLHTKAKDLALQLWIPSDETQRNKFLETTRQSYPEEVAADMNVSLLTYIRSPYWIPHSALNPVFGGSLRQLL